MHKRSYNKDVPMHVTGAKGHDNCQQRDADGPAPQKRFPWQKKSKSDPLAANPNADVNILNTLVGSSRPSIENLLSSTFALSGEKTTDHRFTIRMPDQLPPWVWWLLACTLGIKHDKELTWFQVIVSTTLHILTIGLAACFGALGLVINIYEVVNMESKSNAVVLICAFKSAVGFSWIMLGIYSYRLARRSFTSTSFLIFIRLHSKTFMKISTSLWISLLCLAVVVVNIYDNVDLWHDSKKSGSFDTQDLIDATCADIHLEPTVCRVYYFFKAASLLVNLIWILLVVAICMSVCRTLAICIRRFTRELAFDSKIFEEYILLKASQQNTTAVTEGDGNENHDDFDAISEEVPDSMDGDTDRPSFRKKVWHSLREYRRSGMISHCGDAVNVNASQPWRLNQLQNESSQILQSRLDEEPTAIQNEGNVVKETETVSAGLKEATTTTPPKAKNTDGGDTRRLDDVKIQPLPNLSTMEAPIMSNEDIMFTYSKIVKHLSGMTRLFQRWVSSSFAFVLMWCIFLVFFWISKVAEVIEIVQLLVPILVLGLLVSAYAEVNLEGMFLLKYMLPTENRMPVIYYMNNRPLELKVYSFTLTYNVLATFIAGIAFSFATKIILANL